MSVVSSSERREGNLEWKIPVTLQNVISPTSHEIFTNDVFYLEIHDLKWNRSTGTFIITCGGIKFLCFVMDEIWLVKLWKLKLTTKTITVATTQRKLSRSKSPQKPNKNESKLIVIGNVSLAVFNQKLKELKININIFK